MTRDAMIKLAERIENHYDFTCTGGPLSLCVEWQQLLAALRSRPAPPDDLVPVTRAQLASIEWALYVDTQRKCPVCDALRRSDVHTPDCWLAAALAAPAPVAAPAPETRVSYSCPHCGREYDRPVPAPETRTCGCGPSDECRDDGCQCACHLPAPETPAPDYVPPSTSNTVHSGDGSVRDHAAWVAMVERVTGPIRFSIDCTGEARSETPAPDAMPCPECLGMPCAACNGTGRRQEAQP